MGNPVIDEAIEKVKDIEKKINEFFDKVNDFLSWVPGHLEDLIQPILDGMEWLRGKIEEFWEELKDFLDNTGNPDKLEKHAEEWRESVGKPLKTIADSVALEKLSTNTEWMGSGAEAYKAIVPAQGKGLEGLKSLSDELATTLKDLANGIENFWIAMAVALAAAIVGLVTAITTAASGVGIPVAIAAIVAALGAVIAILGAAVIELKTIYDTIDTQQDTIETELTNLGDEWAKATPENGKKIANPKEWEPL